MTLREFTARENLYEWLETGRCRGLTDKFIAVEAKRLGILLPPKLEALTGYRPK